MMVVINEIGSFGFFFPENLSFRENCQRDNCNNMKWTWTVMDENGQDGRGDTSKYNFKEKIYSSCESNLLISERKLFQSVVYLFPFLKFDFAALLIPLLTPIVSSLPWYENPLNALPIQGDYQKRHEKNRAKILADRHLHDDGCYSYGAP